MAYCTIVLVRIIFLLILAGILGTIIYVRYPATRSTPAPKQNENQVLATPNARVVIDNRTYFVYWREIEKNLTLIPNFERKIASSRLMDNCTYGANGGFYTEDFKPIGLFISDGALLSTAIGNATFNGYFVKTDHFSLTRQPPTDSVEFAVQSGPYVTPKSRLNIKNDTYARRVLVGRSGNTWRFLAITEKENTFSGPILADLPTLLGDLNIDEALNLDGGSASAFYSESGVRLGELTPIGSFFCGK